MSLDDLTDDQYVAQQDIISYAVEFPAAYALAFQEQVEEFFEHLVCMVHYCTWIRFMYTLTFKFI